MLETATIHAIADIVVGAQDGAYTITKFTDAHPDMTIEDSYAVQDELLRRWQARGRKLVGLKAGLTSKAKMDQMGVHVPSFGILMNDTLDPDMGVVPMDKLIHPRVEAEIAFVMKDALSGPDVSVDEIITATDFVQPAVEIIDSRFEKFKFDLVSVVADNGSSARFVMGGRARRPQELSLDTIGIVFEKNGEVVATASSAAVLGHPARAIQMLVAWLHERGRVLPAGTIVLTGGATEAVAVAPGDFISARFQDLGAVSFRMGQKDTE
ncbi:MULTISPECIES: 2-oxo-3-hexenedioate decarboxylase [Sphingomonadaceae]|uniref:2-oxo-3-hexenedioate decarboxylase n=1 Tax=Rhizorhabdus wittichii TaxID=160791 RepID=A0A975DAY7_9SPHN|nr:MULTISPECIES: 2-oxo-3-hexenedioate decarboxylase [Sphingomonadaceae]QTH24805.1 2-oxo-3-hexenedioate decarboxylase [Rhizorhabdus wittichii]QUM74450.1 2-oxo-3-hexenedioate decarboxylase [Sphingopyxis granuli]